MVLSRPGSTLTMLAACIHHLEQLHRDLPARAIDPSPGSASKKGGERSALVADIRDCNDLPKCRAGEGTERERRPEGAPFCNFLVRRRRPPSRIACRCPGKALVRHASPRPRGGGAVELRRRRRLITARHTKIAVRRRDRWRAAAAAV